MDLVFEFNIIDSQKSNFENWRLCQLCKQDMIGSNKNSNPNLNPKIKMKHSFLTCDTGIDGDKTLVSEKISPEDEHRLSKKGVKGIKKKSIFNKKILKFESKTDSNKSSTSNIGSENDSCTNFISDSMRLGANLSVVDEEKSNKKMDKKSDFGSNSKYTDQYRNGEYLMTTERQLLANNSEEKQDNFVLSNRDDKIRIKRDMKIQGYQGGINKIEQEPKKLFTDISIDDNPSYDYDYQNKYDINMKQINGYENKENIQNEDTYSQNIGGLGENQIINEQNSLEKAHKIQFQSFKHNNTPKIPSIKRQKSDVYSSGNKRLETSAFSKEERYVSLKDSSIFLAAKNEFSFYNNRLGFNDEMINQAKFKLSNKKPRLNFDEIQVSPKQDYTLEHHYQLKNESSSQKNISYSDIIIKQPDFDRIELE